MERGGIGLEPLRGHKAWGLLAFLLRSQVPPSRERVASLLFPEADDPLGTLRWTLSVLRRQMGDQAELGGDPLQLTLRPGSLVDVDVLARGTWMEAVALPGLGHELLDGLVFRASPGFEIWLENERRHVMGMTSAVLHQAALAFLARGETISAAHHAAELLRLNPYDENAHVLMVRCLRAVGDPDAALRQVEAATEVFKRELDVEPTPALRAAAVAFEVPVAGHVSRNADVRAQIEAGEAALAARTKRASPPCTRGPPLRRRPEAEASPLWDGARSAGCSSCGRTTSGRRSPWTEPPNSERVTIGSWHGWTSSAVPAGTMSGTTPRRASCFAPPWCAHARWAAANRWGRPSPCWGGITSCAERSRKPVASWIRLSTKWRLAGWSRSVPGRSRSAARSTLFGAMSLRRRPSAPSRSSMEPSSRCDGSMSLKRSPRVEGSGSWC